MIHETLTTNPRDEVVEDEDEFYEDEELDIPSTVEEEF